MLHSSTRLAASARVPRLNTERCSCLQVYPAAHRLHPEPDCTCHALLGVRARIQPLAPREPVGRGQHDDEGAVADLRLRGVRGLQGGTAR